MYQLSQVCCWPSVKFQRRLIQPRLGRASANLFNKVLGKFWLLIWFASAFAGFSWSCLFALNSELKQSTFIASSDALNSAQFLSIVASRLRLFYWLKLYLLILQQRVSPSFVVACLFYEYGYAVLEPFHPLEKPKTKKWLRSLNFGRNSPIFWDSS